MFSSDAYYRYLKLSTDYARRNGLDPATKHNGAWDAFRHAFTSAAM